MEILRTKEALVSCPYNPAHYIRKYRMERHLVKCRRNYPDSEIVICDFNSTHDVPQPELAYHHEYCPDRKFMELAIYQENETPSSSKIKAPPVNFVDFPLEEWDDDDTEQTYDPESYCIKNEIIRKIDSQSPVKRRNFRIMERKRLNQLTASKEKQEESQIAQIPKSDESEISEILKRDNDECISQIMEKLSIGSVTAVIPKISKNNKNLPDDILKDYKLIVKKRN